MMLLKAHFVNDYTSKAELIIFVRKNRKSQKCLDLKKSQNTEKNPKKSERKTLKSRRKSQKIQAKIIEFGNVLCPENRRKIPEKRQIRKPTYILSDKSQKSLKSQGISTF